MPVISAEDISNIFARAARSKKLQFLLISSAIMGGLMISTSAVSATLTATTSNTHSLGVTTGTLKLAMSPAGITGITSGWTTSIVGMMPGDTQNRYVNFIPNGTLNFSSASISATPSTPVPTIFGDPNRGLQLTITACDAPWTNTGSCTGNTFLVLPRTPVANFAYGSSQTITLPAWGLNQYIRTQFSLFLPESNDEIINGNVPSWTALNQSGDVTWTVAIKQNDPTITHS